MTGDLEGPPWAEALAGAGDDLKGLSGNSAIIVVSDFEEIEGVDDIRPKSVMENVAKLKAAYGDRLCIYPIQVGKNPTAQEARRADCPGSKVRFRGKCRQS